MKEFFETTSIDDLIKYRLKRACETLEEADYNAKGGYLMPPSIDFIILATMLHLH